MLSELAHIPAGPRLLTGSRTGVEVLPVLVNRASSQTVITPAHLTSPGWKADPVPGAGKRGSTGRMALHRSGSSRSLLCGVPPHRSAARGVALPLGAGGMGGPARGLAVRYEATVLAAAISEWL